MSKYAGFRALQNDTNIVCMLYILFNWKIYDKMFAGSTRLTPDTQILREIVRKGGESMDKQIIKAAITILIAALQIIIYYL